MGWAKYTRSRRSSLASNLLPFGGAAGIGLGYSMTRRWQIAPDRFAAYTAISNAWNVVAKLVVGSLVLGGAALLGVPLPPGLRTLVSYGALGVLTSVAVGGTLLGRLRRRRDGMESAMLGVRSTTGAVIAAGWGRLTLGVVAYLGLQALLLVACLVAVGGQVPLAVEAVAFAAERLLTLIPFTPGGAGSPNSARSPC